MQEWGYPPLDPKNPHQMYAYLTAILYASGDEASIRESDKAIGAWGVDLTQIALDEGLKSIGAKRGNPVQRQQAYWRKMQWAQEYPGEDLWAEQQQKFPRHFDIDAKDAVALGALVPPWVQEYVMGPQPAAVGPQVQPLGSAV